MDDEYVAWKEKEEWNEDPDNLDDEVELENTLTMPQGSAVGHPRSRRSHDQDELGYYDLGMDL